MRVEEILGKLVEFPFFMYCILLLSKPRFSIKTMLIATSAVAVPYMLVGYLVISYWHVVIYAYPALDLAYRIVNILLMALAALGLTRQRFTQSLFIMASTYVTITVVDVLAVVFLLTARIPELVAKCILYLILSFLIYSARKPFRGILSQTKKGWWLLCSVPLILIVNFLLVSAIPVTLAQNPAGMPSAIILCITTTIIYITFFYMIWEMHKQNQLEQNLMALRLSVSALEHENELIIQNEKKYALFRHDLRHIRQMLSDCLEHNDISGARELLASLDQNAGDTGHASEAGTGLNPGIVRRFTGHKPLDAILNRYIDQAKEEQVDITVRVDPVAQLTADKTELAVVLANALENAVNACREMPEGVPRAIRLDGRRRGTQFFIEIANTYTGNVTFDPDTGLPVKEIKANHGLGSQSIAFFAKKYGAALQYQIGEGWFHLRLLL